MNIIHLFFQEGRGRGRTGQDMTGQYRTGQARTRQGDSLLGWTFIGENTKVSDDMYDAT